ncbi:kinesin-like protein KIF14 isoform X2 [Mytilus trossulus]|uniref:kinesin-like protein KIF14 isoform X2 n=1 Tax=Mytilus trossulus TaxID=6551 RepID=UPI003004E72D
MRNNKRKTLCASSGGTPLQWRKVKEPRGPPEMDRFDFISPNTCKTPKRRYTEGDKLIATPECYNAVQLEDLSRFEFHSDDDDQPREDSSSLTVAVRVRPLNLREEKIGNIRCVVSMCDKETTVTKDNGSKQTFTYDFSFWSYDKQNGNFSDQERIYKLLAQPLLVKAFEGYNTCLFAYGQTGSGKSYSIMGQVNDDRNEIGIIPRFCEELFSRVDHEVTRDSEMVKINVEISFFEIYNEKIHDLLASSKEKGGKSQLKVREHPSTGPYVEGLSMYVVNSFEDVEGWITLGNKNRATATTGMNERSSRSHSVFTLVLTQTRTDEVGVKKNDPRRITSKINLVDLAGSERQSQAKTEGDRLREATNINKSLTTLGMVISSLSKKSTSGKKKFFIPYRDSVLTWLLKESIGGNSKTAMLATISPTNYHKEETLSTLRYAKIASSIVNTARVNEDPTTKLIKELRAEIDRLKISDRWNRDEQQSATQTEIDELREKCVAKEKEIEEMKQSWELKLQQSEERKAQENKNLEKSGITCKVDNKMPNLVNLNEDPQLSEMLLYVIKEGQTRVGRMCDNSKHEIQLNGALIAENHCIINNLENVISITPIDDAPTYVNGNLISEPVILQHGDRVILGGDHYFRFNHPKQVRNRKQTSGQEVKKDFEFAKQELLNVQEQRLQSELEEARRQAQEEMLTKVEEVKKEAMKEQRAVENKLAECEQLLKNQSEEVQMAEQGRLEADDTIQKLKKQKMLLEQELMVGRKRQQLEARAAERAQLSPASTKGSRLKEFLETEKQKVTQRLEQLKQKRSDISSPTRRNAMMENQLGKRDLYKIALSLREANKISQLLKKNMTFSREDYLEDDKLATAIKVTNSELGLCTFWDVPKFEDRLAQMRDLYQNDCESSADDEVFNDPSESWLPEAPTTPSTPRSPLGNSFNKSPFRQFLLSGNSSVTSPRSFKDDTCSCPSHLTGTALAKMCESVTLTFVENIQDGYLEESIADKIVMCSQAIKKSAVYLIDSNSSQDKESETNDEETQCCLLKLATNIQTLSSHCTVWANMYVKEQRHSRVIQDLTTKLKEHVKVMGNHVVRFFQGWGNDIDSLICDSGSKIVDCVLTVCKLTGEMSLATDMNMISFEQLNCEESDKNELSPDVCHAFLAGCDLLVDKSLQGPIKTLEEWECKAQNLADLSNNNLSLGEIPQHIEELVSSMKILFSTCQELQVDMDTSVRESYGGIPLQFYSVSYKRSQGLIHHISNLWENVQILLNSAEPLIKGHTIDCRKLCKYSDLIQRDISKLVLVSSKDNFKMDSSSSDSDSSVLSELQMQKLEYAAKDVHLSAGCLIQKAEKLLRNDKISGTPRGKRLLPPSPDKAVNSPLSNKFKLDTCSWG